MHRHILCVLTSLCYVYVRTGPSHFQGTQGVFTKAPKGHPPNPRRITQSIRIVRFIGILSGMWARVARCLRNSQHKAPQVAQRTLCRRAMYSSRTMSLMSMWLQDHKVLCPCLCLCLWPSATKLLCYSGLPRLRPRTS